MVVPVDDATAEYLNRIGRIAILSREQQLLHSKRIRQWLDWPGGPDQAPAAVQRTGQRSRTRMVESNLRMVVFVAKKYANRSVPLADLIQEGNIGLVTACERFDPERGYCFSTFSYWWIRQGITRYLNNASRLIRVPCNTNDMTRRLGRLQEQYMAAHGRQPSLQTLAELSQEPLHKVQLALDSITVQPGSLDFAFQEGSSLNDVIRDERIPDPYLAIDYEREEQRLREMLADLTEVQKEIVERLTFEQCTTHQLAKAMGLSLKDIYKEKQKAAQHLSRCLGRQRKTRPYRRSARPAPATPGSDPRQLCFENFILPA